MVHTERYLRHVTASVLQWYLEFEDGVVGSYFEPRLLNYRIDVERIFEHLAETEQELLLAIHRDGKTPEEAALAAGWVTDAAERLVAVVEVKLGRALVAKGMLDLTAYISKAAN